MSVNIDLLANLSVIIVSVNGKSQCWSIAGSWIISSRDELSSPLVNIRIRIESAENNIGLLAWLNRWIKPNAQLVVALRQRGLSKSRFATTSKTVIAKIDIGIITTPIPAIEIS